MKFDRETCYRALQAHDRRFDGLFFVCVTSTKIYCRPVCPTHVPMLQNCEFRETAAEAESAGFRPCLRCRPERAPQVGASMQDSLAHRIAMHIDETLLIDETLQDLAVQYSVSDRHMRRIFQKAYGIEPSHYVRTRRLLFAKQLLQDTTMPILQVAYAAGFGSGDSLTRQMNQHYGFTPSRLRHKRTDQAATALILRADYRPPLAWQDLLDFLQGRSVPHEWVDGQNYHRLHDGYEIVVSNNAQNAYLEVQIPVELAIQAYRVMSKVRTLFDLRANPGLIAEVLSQDPSLATHVAAHPGLRVPGCWDNFEMLLRVIVGQQVSVAAATTVMRRLVDGIGATASRLAASSPEQITAIGMPFKRATTIHQLAVMVYSKQFSMDQRDPDIFYAALVAIPGIGPWTASYLCMRVLHWPDAFPVGDLGLQKALIPGQRVTEKALTAHAEAWRPWRSYAAILLWQSLQNQGG